MYWVYWGVLASDGMEVLVLVGMLTEGGGAPGGAGAGSGSVRFWRVAMLTRSGVPAARWGVWLGTFRQRGAMAGWRWQGQSQGSG